MFRLAVFLAVAAVAYGRSSHLQKDFIHRIVGGTPADIEDFPFAVTLQESGFQYCAGAILNAEWVVTAAHCTDGSTTVEVVSGVTDKYDGSAITTEATVFQHEDFDGWTLENDISLLKLSTPLTLDATQNSIRTATRQQFTYEDLIVVGWGTTSEDGDDSDTLLKVTVPFVDDVTCEDLNGGISESMLCAGEEGKDSCQGDSGGPIVNDLGDGTYEHVGIVSWGYGCAQAGYPGVYTETAHFSDWMILQMA
ncbi:unnamed protein product [Cyprideis torosa]|uniref:Uncharacterized protein n=1 Tax=Cyprideis torosa TaxID=163714 RepID=A0A7R8WH86_9CRUS|nr:unnamed protein product [Cyprideis torosa]CAG0897488.1 unnamed protein product [Cyprideis torosa]